MKILSVVLCIFFFAAVPISQAQTSTTDDALATYKEADKKLNEVYQRLLEVRKADVVFLKNLRSAQRLWIQFRDAQLALEYPKSDSMKYGVAFPSYEALYLARLTEERTRELREWIDRAAVGLVLYYPFDGNAIDESGNGRDGTVDGATLTADRFGRPASAYDFNGRTSTIRCGDILDDVFSAPVAKFTVSGWAKTRTCGSVSRGGGFIIGKNAGGNDGPYQWSISHLDGLVFAEVFSDTAIKDFVELVSPMSTNQWFHFALVFDGSQPEMQRLKLFVNGLSLNSTVRRHLGTLGTTTVNSQQHLTIGASHFANGPLLPGSFYEGIIDDICIFAKALTPEEVEALYLEQ